MLTIGHSNHPIDRFIGLLNDAGATAIADVRSVPASRRYRWFTKGRLAQHLSCADIAYVPLDTLGGRPSDPMLIKDGAADYQAMAATPAFRAGLDRVVEGGRRFRVCLMCAEREPLDCHRCLLVARALAERNTSIGHILADGAVEPHGATEERLMALSGTGADLFQDRFQDRAARLAEAYRLRARAAAYRPP